MRPRRSRFLKLKQLFKGKFLMVVLVLAGVGSAIYGFFFSPFFDTRSVEVSTAYKDINVENLKKSIEEMVLGEHLLLVSTYEVESSVYDTFPDVSSLRCGRSIFSRTFECEAIGFELVAIIKHEAQRYYINENGVVTSYDSRKLGLPVFDLILNPVFAEIESRTASKTTETEEVATVEEAVLQPVQPAPSNSLTTSILNGNQVAETPLLVSDLDVPDRSLFFIQPDQAPPEEPLILEPEIRVFEVTIGQKILDPKELQTILLAIQELEKVLERKVIEAKYVQVAGELSLKSKPAVGRGDGEGENGGDSGEVGESETGAELAIPQPSDEDPEHEFTVLLDLRRDLEDQFIKLSKSKEVIDFTQVSQIDLSIDGEKVFYR
jgi:hypothetical protein